MLEYGTAEHRTETTILRGTFCIFTLQLCIVSSLRGSHVELARTLGLSLTNGGSCVQLPTDKWAQRRTPMLRGSLINDTKANAVSLFLPSEMPEVKRTDVGLVVGEEG